MKCLNKNSYHTLHKMYCVLHMFRCLYLFSVIADISPQNFKIFLFQEDLNQNIENL